MHKLSSPILYFLFILVLSCQSDINVIKIRPLRNSTWASSQKIKFEFKNENIIEPVNFLYQVQYQPNFPFQNIWLKYKLINPKGDTMITAKDNLFLFEPSTGRPTGTGSKDRIYLNAYFLKNVTLKDTGTYQILLQHEMRVDSLFGIEAIGLKIKDQ
jgi:gliding motility-associated lipoprotein GldH